MLASVATLASIFAAVAAVIAFGLGITRTARLRRREQLFRDCLPMMGPDSSAQHVVRELHRAALAEIISRQLTSPWRVIWPWACWFGLVALNVQTGYLLADYLASDTDWDYVNFSTKLFGDATVPFFAAAVVLGVLPQVFLSLVFTVVGRAEVARNFFDGKGIEEPITYMRRSVELDYGPRPPKQPRPAVGSRGARLARWLRSAGAAFTHFAVPLVPGLFVVALGLNIGMSYWLEKQPGSGDDARLELIDSLGAFPGIAILAVSVLAVLTLLVVSLVADELRKFALPSRHPHSRLVVDRQSNTNQNKGR